MSRADESLEHRNWAAAEVDLRLAIRQGNLAVAQTQKAWAELGVALTMRARLDQARAAFMRAALISPSFDLPRSAPARARAIADAVRAEAKELGRWQVASPIPDKVGSDKPLSIEVTVGLPRGRIAKRLRFVAEQFTTNQKMEQIEEAAPTNYRFEVPVSVMAGADLLVVRITLLDKENNLIAELSKIVHLEREAAPGPAPENPEKPPENPENKPPPPPPPPPDANAEPSGGGAASSAKVFNLHGTVRTLAAAVQQPLTRSVLDGASTSEGRLTLKIVPTETVTIDSHLLQVFAFATFPGSINDATTLGPVRYRALALSNTFAGSDRSTATVIVDRLDVKFALSSFDVTIGRQPLNFSKGFFWSPLDVFLPFSPRTIDREYKAGVDAVRLDVPLGEASGLSVVGAAGAPLTYDFAANQLVQSSRPFAFDAASSVALARAFTNVGGFDFSLQAGSVYGGYHAGAGVAGEVATIGVRAEATYFLARDTPPLIVPSRPNPVEVQIFRTHPRFLFGFERRFESSLYVSAEYLYNGVVPGNGDYLTPTLQLAYGETPDLARHLAGAVASYEIIPTLVARVSGVVGISPDASGLIAPSVDWSAAENADLQAGALVSVGRAPILGPNAPPVLTSEFGTFPTVYYLFFKLYF